MKNEKMKKNRLQSCIKMIICGFTKKKEKQELNTVENLKKNVMTRNQNKKNKKYFKS